MRSVFCSNIILSNAQAPFRRQVTTIMHETDVSYRSIALLPIYLFLPVYITKIFFVAAPSVLGQRYIQIMKKLMQIVETVFFFFFYHKKLITCS